MAECRAGAFDGVTTAYRNLESFDLTGRIDNELLDVLPSSLRFLCHNGSFLHAWPAASSSVVAVSDS